jgi:acetoin utilization deacetylase AcuC-like enzyme
MPYVFALEGGYDLKALSNLVLQTIGELLEL